MSFSDTSLQTASFATEWLEVNGLGDYASSTSLLRNSRRYHGLLVANLERFGRHVLLSTLEEWVITQNGSYSISSRQHPYCLFPNGEEHLQGWQNAPYPRFQYHFDKYTLTKELVLLKKKHCLLVRYTLEGAGDEQCTLQIHPLLAFRSYHSLSHANMDLQVKTFPVRSGCKIQPYNSLPPLFMQVQGDFSFYPSPDWIYNTEYQIEQQRGFDFSEDLFSPGLFDIALRSGESVYFAASTDELMLPEEQGKMWHKRICSGKIDLTSFWQKEVQGRGKKHCNSLIEFLEQRTESFLIRTPSGANTLLAGYHWFDSWGRDTLIALPGASFFAHRRGVGLSILRRITDGISDGLIPNTFTSDGHPQGWNSVDASLWYAWTVQQLIKSVSGEEGFSEWKKEIYRTYAPAIYGIVQAYRDGHVPYVHLDKQGLLDVGTAKTQLTWMDAQVNGEPVTPRWGYPVEIEALWFNTLAAAHTLAEKLGDKDPCPPEQLRSIQQTFLRRFMKKDGTLVDVWRSSDDGGPDPSCRPNQLLAFSLPFPIISPILAGPLLDKIKTKLLTPYGLRTLSPLSPLFKAHYKGGSEERDRAYHQGTVWPWLLGPYVDALFAYLLSRDSDANKIDSEAKELLETIRPLFTKHLFEAGYGRISEIFSATEPYEPDGCIAQAWSEGEVLRALFTIRSHAPRVYREWEESLSLPAPF